MAEPPNRHWCFGSWFPPSQALEQQQPALVLHRDAGAAQGPCVARSCSSASYPAATVKSLGKRLWLPVTPALPLANDCTAHSYLSNEQQLASG